MFLFLNASISASSSSRRLLCEPLRMLSRRILSSADCISFSKPNISRRICSAFCESSSRTTARLSRSPLTASRLFSFSAISLLSFSTVSRAVILSALIFSMRSLSILSSSISSFTPPDEDSYSLSASLYSPSRRIFSSLAERISPSIPLRSAIADDKSSASIFSCIARLFFLSSRSLTDARSLSISLLRESIPTPCALLPPVIEPPALIT